MAADRRYPREFLGWQYLDTLSAAISRRSNKTLNSTATCETANVVSSKMMQWSGPLGLR